MSVEVTENGLEVVRFSDLPLIVPLEIVGTGIARGSEIVSGPEDIAKKILAVEHDPDLTEERIMQIAQGVGDSLLPRASASQTTESLGLESAERALSEAESRHGIKRSDVGVVYVGSSTLNTRAPDFSKLLHEKLGIGRNAHTLTVNNACQGGLDAIKLAAANLAAFHDCGNGNVALVGGTDKVSDRLDEADTSTQFIFSDMSATTVLQHDPDMETGIVLQSALTESDTKESFMLGAESGDTIKMHPRYVLSGILNLLKHGLDNATTKGNPTLTARTRAGKEFELDLDGLKFIAPHLASELVLRGMSNILQNRGYDTSRFVNNFFSLANSSSPTAIANLIYALRQYKPKSGEHSMSISAAVGFSMLFLAYRH